MVAVHCIFPKVGLDWLSNTLLGYDSITKYSYKINLNNLFLLKFFFFSISNSQNCEMRPPPELCATQKNMGRVEIQSSNIIVNFRKRILLPNWFVEDWHELEVWAINLDGFGRGFGSSSMLGTHKINYMLVHQRYTLRRNKAHFHHEIRML